MVLNLISKVFIWLLVVSAVAVCMSELVPPQTHSYETGSVAIRGSMLWTAASIWEQLDASSETATLAGLFEKFARMDHSVKSLGIQGQVIIYVVTWFWIAVLAAYMLLPRRLRIGRRFTDAVSDTPSWFGRWTSSQAWFCATLLLVCGLIYQMTYTDRTRAFDDLIFRCSARNTCGYDQTRLRETKFPTLPTRMTELISTEITGKRH